VPTDAECKRWLDLLVVGAQPSKHPACPLDDATVRKLLSEAPNARPRSPDATTSSIVEELRRIVGRENVINSANDLRIFERDTSIEGAIPDAVVLAPRPTAGTTGPCDQEFGGAEAVG